MSYISPISKIEKDNLPGLLQLRIARVADVQAFPRIIGGRLIGDIVFNPGTGFVPWQVVQGTGNFRSDSVDSQEGSARDQQLPFSVVGPDENILERMERDRFIVYYLDANLKPIVFGTPERPVLFRYSHNTGTIGGGRNEYSGLFYSIAPQNKAFYSGSVTDFIPLVVIRLGSIDGEVLATLGEGESISLDGDFFFKEMRLPILSSNINRFATINYTREGIAKSVHTELGKTIILLSEFSIEFALL